MTQRKTHNSTTIELHGTMEKPVFGGEEASKNVCGDIRRNFPSTKNVASIFGQ